MIKWVRNNKKYHRNKVDITKYSNEIEYSNEIKYNEIEYNETGYSNEIKCNKFEYNNIINIEYINNIKYTNNIHYNDIQYNYNIQYHNEYIKNTEHKVKIINFPFKKSRIGPQCDFCMTAITDNILYDTNRKYHIECFPCKLCGIINKNNPVQKNGYHYNCQPCFGCIKPFRHLEYSLYCSEWCKTKAPIISFIYISSIRNNTPLYKDLLYMIYVFAYGPIQNIGLSIETKQMINDIEKKYIKKNI